MIKRVLTLLAIVVLANGVGEANAWDSARLSVPVMVNGHVIPYPEFAIFVMPDTAISFGFVEGRGDAQVSFAGKPLDRGVAMVRAAKEPGFQVLEIRNQATGESSRINVFTMVPAGRVGKDGRLNGYRIGRYPSEPLRGLDIYLPPKGFVEVTRENANTKVSPNFTLGQFLAKQESDYPKYLVLRSSLLLKLESILERLNATGHRTERLVVMSGYRTPFYNRAIGNVQYSRHVWGGATDFYIDDSPRDGVMDDLNKDGKVNREDARWLAEYISRMSKAGSFGPHIGGIGVYGSTAAHGPFVHVDVRGTRARW